MSQQILFKRGTVVYTDLSKAKDAFDKLTWTAGEPVIASYLENSNIRLLFAIGIADGEGSSCYRIISNFDEVKDLQQLFVDTDKNLSSHIEALANGTTAGHVINSEDSAIEFIDGVAKLKEGSVSLDTLVQSAASGIIGVKSEDLATGGKASLMTWEEVIVELGSAGFNTFKKITVGGQSIEAASLQDSLEINLDSNFTVTKDGKKLNVSFTAGEAEFNTSLTTASGPIKISGTTDAIVTEFNMSEDEGIAFPLPPTIENSVQVGSLGDNEKSAAIPTVGYVVQKINKALAETDSMHYKGVFDPSTETLPAGDAGDTYKISVNGTVEGLGELHAGDMIICNADGTGAGDSSKWDLIEVHNGSLMGPADATSGNLLVFENNNTVSDSGVSVNDIVTKSTKVTAGDGLELDSSNKTGVLASDVKISHSKVNVTETDKETGDVVKSVTVNEFGHVTEVVYGEASKSLELAHGGEDGSWSNNYLTAGKFINGISLTDNVLTAYATDLPGTVRISGTSKLGFLKDLVAGKSNIDNDNEYAISTSHDTVNNKLELSVVIDKIDGGTFE